MSKLFSKTKKKETKLKIPTKRSMNLYVEVKDGNSWQVVLPLAIILLAAILALYKFGVVNRINHLNDLQHENAELEARLDSINKDMSDYDELTEEYRRFTTGYLQEGEVGIVGRTRIMEMLHDCTDDIGFLRSASIESNQVGIVVNIPNLEDIDVIQDRLNDQEIVDEIMVSTAKGTNNVQVEGYIIFTVLEDSVAADNAYESKLTDAERAARYEQYAEAVRKAREKNDDKAAAEASAIYTGVAAKGSQQSGAALSGGNNAQAAQQQSVNNAIANAQQPVAAVVQSADSNQVITSGETPPQGFATLEEALAAVNGGAAQ
ncbi:MAG: hypothetical protein Q4E57_01780 [Eubacteriales bacterium]|nr:hypothetical protein [Eubacteriales bacterium]